MLNKEYTFSEIIDWENKIFVLDVENHKRFIRGIDENVEITNQVSITELIGKLSKFKFTNKKDISIFFAILRKMASSDQLEEGVNDLYNIEKKYLQAFEDYMNNAKNNGSIIHNFIEAN